MATIPNNLRFAPLIRVSTEKQEQKGESLRTQKTHIEQAVKYLNGKIPKRCWKYSGQEHATPNQEREKLDQLLNDSSKGLFDAVIICDASRWSRDNIKSKEGLQILRDNGIRFYIGTTEYNLYNPEQSFFLGMSAEIGEYQAKQQAFKSLINRIERAKRNMPSAGKLPFGRTFDKEANKWGIDEEKKRQMEYAAERYLSGESLPEIAKKLNMNHSNLAKLLRERCGDKWSIKFHNDKFNVKETVALTIPRLLPQETIDAIHAKARANQTFTHGQAKHKYLLGRMIFCGHCGSPLFGQANHYKKLYYRHTRKGGCNKFHSIPADIIEIAVTTTVFELFGDRVKMEQAAKDAIPNLREIKQLRRQLENNCKELKKIKRAKDNLLDKVEKGIIDDDDLQERFQKHKEREHLIKEENEGIQSRLRNIPTEREIKLKTQLMLRVKESYYFSDAHLKEMTFEDKRTLLQNIFSGTDNEGNRFGVYVEKKSKDLWIYTIKGLFIDEVGRLEKVKQNMRRKRDAHNGFRLHQR
jgi:DNA invertase Pin-like site-specific DNA recombinase